MPIIDSQVHAYAANTPDRPWYSAPNWPDHVTGDEMVAAMDEVGVDGAILVSAFSMYQYDASYAVEARNTHPGRFGLVKPVDPSDPRVAEIIADWKHTAGTVGIRLLLNRGPERDPDQPPYLLAPIDLQAVKACGVTFVASMTERVVEELQKAGPTSGEAVH